MWKLKTILKDRNKTFFHLMVFTFWCDIPCGLICFRFQIWRLLQRLCLPAFCYAVNPLSTNPTKWSNTLKQFVGKSNFWQFWGLASRGLSLSQICKWQENNFEKQKTRDLRRSSLIFQIFQKNCKDVNAEKKLSPHNQHIESSQTHIIQIISLSLHLCKPSWLFPWYATHIYKFCFW